MLYFSPLFLSININLWWNGQMLGSLTCHYITQQIRLKNSCPYSPLYALYTVKSVSQTHPVSLLFYFLHIWWCYLLISIPSWTLPLPLMFWYNLRQGDTSRRAGGPLGLLSVARSQIPDDTCEPWQSSWFTVAVSGLLCQTKHRHNVFSLTVPQRFPTPKWLQPTFSCTQSGCSSFCNHMLL